jgi:hypothetical protein
MDNEDYKSEEVILYLEDLDEFVSNIIDDLLLDPDEHITLREHWVAQFKGETAIIIDDETYSAVMEVYNTNMLNMTLQNLVFVEKTVELSWDSKTSDFAFKLNEET